MAGSDVGCSGFYRVRVRLLRLEVVFQIASSCIRNLAGDRVYLGLGDV